MVIDVSQGEKAARSRAAAPPPSSKKKSHWGERASWKVADRVSYPALAKKIEELSSEPLLEDTFWAWDHIWGQMFMKVPKSMGQMSADDIMDTTVKDSMKVRVSFSFIHLIYILIFDTSWS